MAQRSQVPKFGNWESEENVPYTAYFDDARRGRSGAKMNPNDPKGNPDIHPEGQSSIRAVSFQDVPDNSPAVPKLGDWDETDPASSERFTQVFERVREEREW